MLMLLLAHYRCVCMCVYIHGEPFFAHNFVFYNSSPPQRAMRWEDELLCVYMCILKSTLHKPQSDEMLFLHPHTLTTNNNNTDVDEYAQVRKLNTQPQQR